MEKGWDGEKFLIKREQHHMKAWSWRALGDQVWFICRAPGVMLPWTPVSLWSILSLRWAFWLLPFLVPILFSDTRNLFCIFLPHCLQVKESGSRQNDDLFKDVHPNSLLVVKSLKIFFLCDLVLIYFVFPGIGLSFSYIVSTLIILFISIESAVIAPDSFVIQ